MEIYSALNDNCDLGWWEDLHEAHELAEEAGEELTWDDVNDACNGDYLVEDIIEDFIHPDEEDVEGIFHELLELHHHEHEHD